MGLTIAFWLDLLSTLQEEVHTQHYKSGIKLMAGELTFSKGDLTAII